ncbi:unnamed protein product [Moneuplotes crassus]|uniref:Uncharacterized protein n=1 Tax=Euplotes crassus TaxID=5936 RepID=A0AAD2CXV4_EUPCR|nr:unnamed protein product [Moneuplotes crassus]
MSSPLCENKTKLKEKTNFYLKQQLDPLRVKELLNSKILSSPKGWKEPNYANIFRNLITRLPKEPFSKEKKPCKRKYNSSFTRSSISSMYYDISKINQDKCLARHFLRLTEKRRVPEVKFMNKVIQAKNIGTTQEYLNINLKNLRKIKNCRTWKKPDGQTKILFQNFRPLPEDDK